MRALTQGLMVSWMALTLMGAEPRDSERRLNEASEVLESARRLSARGEHAAMKQRLDEAEKIYRSILATEQTQRDATLGLSAVLFMQERYNEGLEVMRPLYARLPKDMDVKHQYGIQLYRAGERASAIPLLEDVAKDPKRFDVAWILLQDYYSRSEWERGIPLAERYMKVRPDDVAALGLIGTFYLKVERFEEALALLERSLQAIPDNKAVAVHRANALFRLNRLNEAGVAYEALLAKEPKQPHYLYNLASVRLREKRYADALPLLERFLAIEPTHSAGAYHRVECLVQLQRFDEAEQAIELALKTQPTNPWLYYARSRVAVGKDQLELALTAINGALRFKEDEPTLIAWRGNVQRRLNSLELALIDHRKAVGLEPKEARFYEELGLTYYRMSRFGDARQGFESAYALEPSPRVKKALAHALTVEASMAWEKGDKSSQALLERSLELAPELGLTYALKALYALQNHQTKEAERVLQAAPPEAQDADWQVAKAWVLLVQNQVTQAEAMARTAQEANTRLSFEAWLVQGHAAALQEEWPQALEAFESARKLKDQASVRELIHKSTLELAFDELAKGQAASARSRLLALEKATTRLSEDEKHRIRLAMSAIEALGNPTLDGLNRLSVELDGPRYHTQPELRDLGHSVVAYGAIKGQHLELARQALGKIKQRSARTESLHAALGELEARHAFEKGQFAQAAQLFGQAGAREGTNQVHLLQNEAAARFMAGDVAQAESAWELLAGKSEHGEVFYNLGNLKGRQGKHREAFEWFSKAARLKGSPIVDTAKMRADTKGRMFGWGGPR